MSSLGIGIDLNSQCGRKYLKKVLTSTKWLARRVVTIEVLDGSRFRKHVSLDIDIEELKKNAPGYGGTHLVVPLGLLRKGLMLNFSVEDNDGHPLPLMTSDRDAKVWSVSLVQTVLDDPSIVSDLQSKEVLLQEEILVEEIYYLVASMDSCDSLGATPELLSLDSSYAFKKMIVEAIHSKYPPKLLPMGVIDTTELERVSFVRRRETVWNRLLQSPTFTELLKSAILNFIPIVAIPVDYPRFIVKYSIEEYDPLEAGMSLRAFEQASWLEYCAMTEYQLRERGDQFTTADKKTVAQLWWLRRRPRYIKRLWIAWKQRLLQAWGLRCYNVIIDTSLVTFASREHVRIVCPPGVCIGTRIHRVNDAMPPPIVLTRSTRERAMLYTSSPIPVFNPSRINRMMVGMRPRMRGFLPPAFIVLGVSLIVSICTWIFVDKLMCPPSSCGNDTDSVITMLLIALSFGSVYASRDGEHSYRSRMLKWPRYGIMASGILGVLIGVSIVFLQSAFWTRSLAGLATLVEGLSLVGCFCYGYRSRHYSKIIRNDVNNMIDLHDEEIYSQDRDGPVIRWVDEVVRRIFEKSESTAHLSP